MKRSLTQPGIRCQRTGAVAAFSRRDFQKYATGTAYAYGGAIIQDIPFGSLFFSDLTHYVRSGDFVLALIAESHDLNEYAFALGALQAPPTRQGIPWRRTSRLQSCTPSLRSNMGRHHL